MPTLRTSLLSRPLRAVSNKPEIGILIVWLLVNAGFLIMHGIHTDFEANTYVREARTFIRTGHLETANFRYYFVQIAILSFALKFHLGFVFATAVQMIFNLLATLYFFTTLDFIFKSRKVAFAATLLLLFNLPYQEFNVYLQTESLFQSFTLLLSCYLLRKEKVSSIDLLIIPCALFIISITRPVGLLYIPAVLPYLVSIHFKKQAPATRIMWLFLPTALFLLTLDKAMGSGGSLDFMLPFREEHIICGVPTLLYPEALRTAGNGNSVYAILYYVIHNSGQFFRLAALKSLSFWGLYRSYYSLMHTLFLACYFYTIIFLAACSFPYWWKTLRNKFIYLSGLILLTWATVILTCDDWHNRFFLSISPYLIILATPFILKYSKKSGSGAA